MACQDKFLFSYYINLKKRDKKGKRKTNYASNKNFIIENFKSYIVLTIMII